ncbi:hypothetical protein M8J77_013261 [Diaphorina citri]|nr:hypothetical protein M8J77_013261 [Diaphorina citri]
MSHCSGHLFLLTIQGMVYVLSDSTTDQFQSQIQQFDQLNQQISRVDAELNAMAIVTRAQQLRCRFMTKLCITEGELENAYKFTLHLTHSCDGVTFSPDSWSCYITLANQNVVLPLSIRLGSGDMIQMMFVLTEYQPAPYVNMKVRKKMIFQEV